MRLELSRRDDRADVGRLVERIADAQMAHAGAQFGVERFGDAFRDEQARAGAADLALVEPDGVDEPFDGAVEIGIVEHDEGRFAAELEADSFLPLPAVALRIARPTSVEPVKAILSTPAWATIAAPVSPSPVTILTTPGGRPVSMQISAKASAVSGVYSAGFSTTVLPAASAGAIFQASISKREVPRDDLTADADRLRSRKFALGQRRPAGVMVEVAGDERHVDVAQFADRLAVVERLQHREEALALLHMPRQRIEMLRALVAGKRRPPSLRLARRGDRRVDVGRGALADAGDALALGGVEHVEQGGGFGEAAVDEMTEAVLMRLEPRQHMLRALGRRAVVHRLENVLDQRHREILMPSGGGKRRNSGRSPSGRADARCRSADRSRRCGTGRAASTAGQAPPS